MKKEAVVTQIVSKGIFNHSALMKNQVVPTQTVPFQTVISNIK